MKVPKAIGAKNSSHAFSGNFTSVTTWSLCHAGKCASAKNLTLWCQMMSARFVCLKALHKVATPDNTPGVAVAFVFSGSRAAGAAAR
mmetsp:Transcript_47425/g.78249  ORF Transcript_47425/g.78249 Transcript_47425/m.78249 type:complete len:87 (-) Transcript_47425:179-439(-)